MGEIPSKYDHRAVEDAWMKQWEAWGIYRWDSGASREETFVVDTPPPTVSGSLHMGHVFSYTHQDLIVRFQRMQGRNIAYTMGWDDNGLPTERRVQNLLDVRCNPHLPYEPGFTREASQKKRDAVEISRRNFIELCAQVTGADEVAFEELWRRLGLSVDWSQTYATIDERSRRVSQASFLDLWEKGLVYNSFAPTMWDTDFQTAVAQAEVEDRPKQGAFHDIRFGVEGGGELTISTTRPELLPACIAVVAHPDDARYQDLFGKYAITPLFKARVPILAAEHADPEKGTGILMICTFGDANDVEWWKQSGLPLRQVLGTLGKLLPVSWGEGVFGTLDPAGAQAAYEPLVGAYVNQARRAIVEQLAEEGSAVGGEGAALAGAPRPVEQVAKFYEKGDRPLEFVTTRQWFVRILEHKEALLAQGRKIQWHPEHFRTRFDHWVEGLNQDWCVSRQRYFGVPFPVWYALDAVGQPDYERPIFASLDSLPVDPLADVPPGYEESQRGQPGGFTGDPDVMDTWATSSMTPQINSHWTLDADRHGKIFPMDLRPQSHEIIRTWAFYTIVKAWMHEDQIPWSDVMISGWVLDPDRKKMSKSKGNVVTPGHLLEEYSADAVRYWSARARLGTDTTDDKSVYKVGRRLATKIFNASRFVLLQLDRVGAGDADPARITAPLDLALVAQLREVIARSTAAFQRFDYALALQLTEESFWSFCDHYLELVKARAYADEDSALRRSAIATLSWALRTYLRLLAPFQPYVTEEVWSWRFAGEGRLRSIHTAPWPQLQEVEAVRAEEIPGVLPAAIEVLGAIRGAKTEARRSLKWPVTALLIGGAEADRGSLGAALDDVLAAGNVDPGVFSWADVSPEEGQRFKVDVTLGDEPSAP